MKKIVILITILVFTLAASCSKKETAKSKPLPEITPGKESAKFRVTSNITLYFTLPCHDTEMVHDLIDLINCQTEGCEIDICAYGLNHDGLVTAIENAIIRGVKIRFAGNKDGNDRLSSLRGSYYEAYHRIALALDKIKPVPGKLRTEFPHVSRFDDFNLRNDQGIMHNKFIIFRDRDGNSLLFTGSTNFTETGFFNNNNNSILIKNNGLSETYREQFNHLLDLPGCRPVRGLHEFTIDNIISVSYTHLRAHET